jgi:hypothetical protein
MADPRYPVVMIGGVPVVEAPQGPGRWGGLVRRRVLLLIVLVVIYLVGVAEWAIAVRAWSGK